MAVGDEAVLLPFAIVGVGVCAASLGSLRQLFGAIAAGSGTAYLIAVRRARGLDVASVVDALREACALPIRIAENDEQIEPDHVYVAAPDDMIAIEHGRIRTRPAVEPASHRGTVDSLMISLAEQAHDRAVIVLLKGLDGEGGAGLTATKNYGGLSIVERDAGDDPTAEGSTAPSSVADMDLPIERIAPEIARYARSLKLVAERDGQEQLSEDIEAEVTQVATILRNVTGHDFHGYKRGTFIRRIHRRMQVLQIGEIDIYLDTLRQDREEVQHLFQDLLIGVTQFFRDPAEFDLLEREIPLLFEGRGSEDQFRVWVPGCATGEEAYSIAILLREHMATLDRPPEVQIFATDLDARALNLARAGRYTSAIARHVRPDRLERWFVREGDTFCVAKELREICIFSPHNIVKDAPFSRVDILSCRNLLIYLNTELQNRVIPIFHFSLRAGGVLFLGASENVIRHQKLFGPIDRRNRVFRRLETATRIIPDFPLAPHIHDRGAADGMLVVPAHGARLAPAVGRQAEAVAERYAPAYVVVDGHGEVLHFSGRTGRYLEPTAGVATLNLTSLIHRDLRLDLRTALGRAIAEGRRVEAPRLVIRQDDRAFGVTIAIEPIGGGDATSFVVVFQDLGPVGDGSGTDDGQPATDEHAQRLGAELRITRDRLQATIEELESTNEELKTSNEEYQSINEELQSANEEMETSKEELQSVNEELQTVNGELSHRVQELGRINSDLKNLLESTQIATVFLDNDLRVRNFTPAATDIFHLREADVGRPLDHVVSRVSYPELQEDVRRVLKTLVPTERSVVDSAGDCHYVARVLPYRSIDNYIGGSVVTFTDMTAVYQAETALRESEQRLASELADLKTLQGVSVELVHEQDIPTLHLRILDAAMALMRSDAASVQRFDEGERTLRLLASSGFHPLSEQFLSVIEAGPDNTSGGVLVHNERLVAPDIETSLRIGGTHLHEYRRSGLRAMQSTPLMSRSGKVLGIISTHWREPHEPLEREFALFDVLAREAADLIERSHAKTALQDISREMKILLAGIPQLVWRANSSGRWTWVSPQWTEYTGQHDAASLGLGWLEQIDPADRDEALGSWSRAEEEGGLDVQLRIYHAAEQRYRWFHTRATPARDEQGTIVEWLGTSTDIDDIRALQARQEVLVGELQHRVRNMLGVVRSVFTRTAQTATDVEEIVDHFTGRLDSLARTQVVVTRSINGLVDLEDLIRDELLSIGASDGSKIRIEGPDVSLSSKTAEAIGLAIHELTTNALKYGALRVPGARLHIAWNTNPGEGGARRLDLVWEEQGVPTISVNPTRAGFGRELIEEALPYRLGAETRLEFRGGGVRCFISIPLGSKALGQEEIREAR
ncbi:CheR family methyltransferase [Sphingomonas nostoxanthinifaciens]|uniref:CheR family methyltransferase n=1 Tax=Sphingomonas nostoxanthinifaciens TaxID=2872652 RepID=UPI001CC20AB9|nr:CheR family methyltransferase [Sphingomonas nostoxanthinifaciens]UAK26243.1 PAS domain-containing protein [Sphingomonas nostoxanthinifaciens]